MVSNKKKRNTPAIQVVFHLNQKGINKVELLKNSNPSIQWKIVQTQPAPLIVPLVEQWIDCYQKGRQPEILLPVVLKDLPPYTTRVLSILREVPLGVTLTYKQLAEVTGNPLGARAVGNACARNPCPLVIPCHRVLAQTGLGGFSGGLDIKQALLDFEKI